MWPGKISLGPKWVSDITAETLKNRLIENNCEIVLSSKEMFWCMRKGKLKYFTLLILTRLWESLSQF